MATIDPGRLTVSVALCTRNGAAFVEAQLESILTQSRLPDEVIISDDASTDSTLEVVRATWARLAIGPGAPILRVISNETPLGVVENFEQATLACTSDLIALSDQDDIWLPGRLETMTARFDLDPSLDLLFSDAALIDAEGRPFGSLFAALEVDQEDLIQIRGEAAFAVLLRRNLVTGATAIVRRGLVDRAAPFASTWVHDEWLAIVAAATSRIDWLSEQLVEYRQHGSNQIGVAMPSLRYKIRRVLEPRGDRYANLLARSEELLDRLRALGVEAHILALAEGKVAHDRFRAGLPIGRLARIIPVLRSARSGAYARYCSRKRLDILRDLLQPQA